MNPPGEADTDGSPSNCTPFFISAVHDLSLYETHAPPSPPPHTRDSLFPISRSLAPLSSLPVQLSKFSCHFFLVPPPRFSPLSLFLSSSLCLSTAALITPAPHPAPPHLPAVTGSLSLVQMCPWSVVAWLGDNKSDFETGGWQPCFQWHTEPLWCAFNCTLAG